MKIAVLFCIAVALEVARPCDANHVTLNVVDVPATILEGAGDCTQSQIDDLLRGSDIVACQNLLDGSVTELERYENACSEQCWEPYFSLFDACSAETLKQVYRAECGRSDGLICQYINAIVDVDASGNPSESLVIAIQNCPIRVPTSCSAQCSRSIGRGKAIYGCCLNNFLNDSVVAQTLEISSYGYLASYDQWNACGIETSDIGFCYGSAPRNFSASLMVSTIMLILVTAFLI